VETISQASVQNLEENVLLMFINKAKTLSLIDAVYLFIYFNLIRGVVLSRFCVKLPQLWQLSHTSGLRAGTPVCEFMFHKLV